MRYTLLNVDTNRISYLLGRPIVDMHTPTDKERPIFLSKSKLVILELTEDEISLLNAHGIYPEVEPEVKSLSEERGNYWIKYFPKIVPKPGGGVYELFYNKSEAELYPYTENNNGRYMRKGPLKQPNYYRAKIDKLAKQGLTGKGVRLGAIAGELTLLTSKNYNLRNFKETYKFGAAGNVIPATGLSEERHGLQCVSLICDDTDPEESIAPIAPDVDLYVASQNSIAASVDWLIYQKNCDVIFISFNSSNVLGNNLTKLIKQKGAIVCVAGGNTWSNTSTVNLIATHYTVNVAMFGTFWFGGTPETNYYYPQMHTNAKENANNARIDFAMMQQFYTRDLGEAGINIGYTNAGTSYAVAYVAGILALYKEKYPHVPMRVLFNLLKLRNRNSELLQQTDYAVPIVEV
jgi:hypothetical protein